MRAQAHHGEKGGGETTHDIGMIETLEHPHPIQNGFQYNFAGDIARCRPGGGISRGREGERGSGERVGGSGGGRYGWAGCSPLSEGSLIRWDVPCRALPYDGHDAGFVIFTVLF